MTETPRNNRFIIGLFILATLIAGFSFGAYQGRYTAVITAADDAGLIAADLREIMDMS